MEPAVADFRAQYRAQIAPRYRGAAHGLAVAVMGVAFLGGALALWGVPGWDQVALIAANLIFANFAIYLIHRSLGHHLRGFAKQFYQRHTKEHHNFFSPEAIAWENARDLRVVFFPLPLLFVVAAAAGGVAYLVAEARTPADGAAVFCTTLSYYLAYELIHFCDHLPEGHIVTRLPGFRYMRAHHRAHHAPRRMHSMNFNIVFPLADLVLGTLVPRAELDFDGPPEG
mgnify:CR=1 FL=1